MSIKKVTLASLILLSLAACSSGGGSGSSSNNTEAKAKPPVHQPSSQNNSSDAKKAEADRVAKEKAEAERLKKEEFERSEREKYKNEKFKQSVFYNLFREEDTLKVGFSPRVGEEQGIEKDSQNQNYKYHRYSPVYNQVYSIVIANYNKKERTDRTEATFHQVNAYGYETPKDKLPKMGKATYSGIAFHNDKTGDLTYQVDFDKKIGSGDIKNLTAFGNIKLVEGKISQDIASSFIQSDATSDKLSHISGKYKLAFFGENAEEIGGNLTFSFMSQDDFKKGILENSYYNYMCTHSCSEIGFGGTRGEIAK